MSLLLYAVRKQAIFEVAKAASHVEREDVRYVRASLDAGIAFHFTIQ